MKEDFGTQLENGSLRFVRDLPGPIQRVWEYLVDPEKRGLWFAGGTMGENAGDEFVWAFDFAKVTDEALPDQYSEMESGVTSNARIVTIEPPTLLVVVDTDETQHIRFELSEEGERVKLVLIQEPPKDYEGVIETAAGWQACLGVLIDNLNGEKPRRFWAEHKTAGTHYREIIKPAE